MITIRHGRPTDVEAWIDGFEAVAAEGRWIGSEAPFDRPARRERWRRMLDDPDVVALVALDAEQLVGNASVHADRGLAELGMWIAASHRGQGIGRRLLDEAVAWTRGHSCHKLTLQVWPHNHAARRLYRSAGFAEEGRLVRQWRRRDGSLWDAIVMGLVLDRETPGGPPERRAAVTTWSLEMGAPGELRPARTPDEPGVAVVRAEVASPELSRFLYTAVGGDYYWLERHSWSYERWRRWLDRDAVATWVLSVRGTPAGYVELEAQDGGDVEIAYFGLLPAFVGRGLGGHLLTEGVRRAWRRGELWATGATERVWVHTCSLDGPHARANYEARGFRVFDDRTTQEDLPLEPPGPWPAAR